MVVLVTIIYLTLVVRWTAHGPYGTIDKAPNVLQWCTTLVDGVSIPFEVRGQEEVVGVEAEQMLPVFIKKDNNFIEDLGD